MFQSPQWGDNSKVSNNFDGRDSIKFQSPQWGDNSKGLVLRRNPRRKRFSPRNGEIILKLIL